MFAIWRTFSGQCRPSGTKKGYISGMSTAKAKGAFSLIQPKVVPIVLPSHIENGPIRKAVTGIMMSIEKNGTNTIWKFAGKTFLIW